MKVKHLLWILLAIVVCAVLFASYRDYQIKLCPSKGGVWDYDKKTCRTDCFKWGEDFGCIKLTDEEIDIIQNCKTANCITQDMVKTICLRNQKAYNLKTQNCKFNFVKEGCNVLDGQWLYPEMCNENNK